METDPHISAELAHQLPADVSLLARDGAVLTLGPGMIEVFGASGICAPGARLSDLVAETDRGVTEAALKALVSGAQTQAEFAVRWRAGTGSGEPVRLSLVAIRDHGETVAVAFDLADRPCASAAAAAARCRAPDAPEGPRHMTEASFGVPRSFCPETGLGQTFIRLPTLPGNSEAMAIGASVPAEITLAQDLAGEMPAFAATTSGDGDTFWHDLQLRVRRWKLARVLLS